MKKFHLLLFLLYGLLQSFRVQSIVVYNNDTDKAALIAFKAGLTNGEYVLNSWNESTHFCKWVGVTCSRRHPQRVSALYLPMSGLLGSISSFIGNLTFLRKLNLTSNELYGEIPSSINFLHRLEYFNLAINSLEGTITTSLRNCSHLAHINLSKNKLVGEIPSWLGSLSMLQYLNLDNNNLTGAIPLSLNNLSSLQAFGVSSNNLEGTIPEGLGSLRGLWYFEVSENHLSGIVPQSFYNQSSLMSFSITDNELEGILPVNIGTNLPNLQYFLLAANRFSGRIPASISNISSIIKIDVASNNFSGIIPQELGKLCPLVLSLQQNKLEATNAEDWNFLRFLTNCSRLQVLAIDNNNLSGIFPNYVANLSTKLEDLYMGANHLSGSIPKEIENLANLIVLALNDNQLTGIIPKSIGKLQNLQLLDLSENKLTGPLPFSVGNLTKLIYLLASNNQIQGPIPATLANLQQLNRLSLSNNALYGTLPPNIFNISSLSYVLDLSKNSLSGKIPLSIGITKVQVLLLSQNKFSGKLPKTLANCDSLEYLDLSANLFSGNIPPFLRTLKSLQVLNLSNNNFYGTIPQELSYIYGIQEMYFSHNNLSGNIPVLLENLNSLFILDISFNNLEGPVPTKGIFSNITGFSISGNIGLCGGVPQLLLPICPTQHNKKISPLLFKILIVLASTIIFLISLLTIFFVLRRRVKSGEKEKSKPILLMESYPKVSYGELVKATDNFSVANLVGSGRYGSVYKSTLLLKYKQISHHAIKVFNLEVQGTSKSFLAECDALRRIRHRNLISLITCCSSTDFKGNEFKALVFDFMPKGNLERWLHTDGDFVLSFIQRVNIAVDVVDAVDYLHNSCEPSIIHCDLKPSNILLDDDLIAHVGDFGLAKLLPTLLRGQLSNSQSSTGIRGTIGYVAPEYGAGGPVSTQADVYSFGIILLEMFTGRTPTDDMFKDGLTLHTFVETAFPEKLHEIVDPHFVLSDCDFDLEIQNENKGDSWNKIQKFLVSIMRIGLMCSKQSPAERKSIRDAAIELHSIRDAYMRAH